MSLWRSDRGAAAVEFAMIVPLLIGLVLTVCQVGAWVLVLVAAHRVADEAARTAGRTLGSDSTSLQVARDIVARDLASPGQGDARLTRLGGAPAVAVDILVPLRVGGWVTPVEGSVTAVAVREPR